MAQASPASALRRFFDRTVRASLGDLALSDDPAADYLSDLLTRFARTENLLPASALPGRRLESVADALMEIQRAWEWDSTYFNPLRERELRRHIGDYTLFMTGLFGERVERLSARTYFIHQGQRAYRFVWEIDRADARPQARLFRRLAERFEGYVSVLDYMRRAYFRPEHVPHDLPFFRRLITEW
jgi:hypothetical protein